MLNLFLRLWPLLFIALVIIIIHNVLPRELYPSAWTLNKSGFVQLTGQRSDPVHLWMAAEKKKNKTSPPILQDQYPFYFTSLLPLPLCSIQKKLASRPYKKVFLETSLPSSQSSSFLSSHDSLPQYLVSGFIDLSCGKQTKPGLGNEVEIIGQ